MAEDERSEFTIQNWSILTILLLYSDPEWDEDAPPLPSRNYSWSDIEDNDEDLSDEEHDEDDEPINNVSIEEHQKLYSSVSPHLGATQTCLRGHTPI